MDWQDQPLTVLLIAKGSEPATVLKVAPRELNVIEDDPYVGCCELGQRDQPGE